ncbi:MAG: NusG domain II-containing protein [Treponema sp.]|nr:NusG domain II-containing protein [Treponema sp.]MCL2250961.1 NusG domain II-containing protein [Treponema sp.]
MRSMFKVADIIIILLIAAFSFFSVFNIYIKPKYTAKFSEQVLIRADGNEWTFPLDAEETIEVKGPLGNTVIYIHEKKAQVLSSPCDNQTCVASGLLSRKGQWAACLPNNVLLLILAHQSILGNEGDIDAVTW